MIDKKEWEGGRRKMEEIGSNGRGLDVDGFMDVRKERNGERWNKGRRETGRKKWGEKGGRWMVR